MTALTTEDKNAALAQIALQLEKDEPEILAENQKTWNMARKEAYRKRYWIDWH